MPKRLLSGTVTSSTNNKTIVVEVTRRVKHKLYKKIIKRVKKYHAHDQNNVYKVGDFVTIQETRPISKMKSWIVYENNSNPEGN
jgi:small subunit ribosomal protein S17